MSALSYIKQVWLRGRSGGTPLSAVRLNYMEDGIAGVDLRAAALEDAVDVVDDRVTVLEENPGGAVTSVNTRIGAVIGLAEESDLAALVSATATALSGKAATTALASHVGDTGNPHSVTKAQVGLANATNTADSAKPVSTAQQAALDLKLPLATVTTKGDMIVATAAGAVTALPVGVDGQSPITDSTQAGGWKLATPAAAGSTAQAILLSSYLGV